MKNLVTCFIIAICALGSVITLHAQTGLKLQIVNIVADPAAEPFTIKIDGQVLTSTLGFREATAFQQLELPAQLEISSSNLAFETITKVFDPEQYEGGTAIITLIGVGDPSKFSTPEERDITFWHSEYYVPTQFLAPSKANVTVSHFATDLPAFDLLVEGETPIATQLAYDKTPEFPLPLVPKKHTLKLTPVGDASTIWKEVEADFSQDAGKFVYLLPSGFLDPSTNQDGPELELIAVYDNGTVKTLTGATEPKKYAQLQLVNASAEPAIASFDVYLNGTRIADNIAFAQATPYLNVPAEEMLTLVIARPNSNDAEDKVLATFGDASFDENDRLIAMIYGVADPSGLAENPGGANIELSLYNMGGMRDEATEAGNVDFMLFHGVTDAAPVDVVVRDGAVLASALNYGDATDYVTLSATETYTIDVKPTGVSDVILKSFTADISPLSGRAVTIFAGGFLDPLQNKDGRALGLYAVTTTGTVVPLPAVTVSVREEHTPTAVYSYPNPATDGATLAYELTVGASVNVTLHDAAGRMVYAVDKGPQTSGAHTLRLPTGNLSAGVYMLTLRAGDIVVNRTLTVTK